jgi:hypothetical protein
VVLFGILWWRAAHPRALQPYDPARQAAACDARLARWFTIGSATVAILAAFSLWRLIPRLTLTKCRGWDKQW